MKHEHDDPYCKTTSRWAQIRWMACWLGWTLGAAARAGLLDRPGRVMRWFVNRLNAIEHGLRCLLIIAIRRLPAPEPAPDRPGRSLFPTSHDVPPDTEPDPVFATIRKPAFAITLAAFRDDPAPAPPVGAGHASRIEQSSTARQPSARRDDLVLRFNALADAFSNPEPHVARMARALVRQGFCLRRRPPTRPTGIARWLVAACAGLMPAAPWTQAPRAPDTS